MVTITFEAPAKLLSMNDRMHWSERNRVGQEWRKAACFHAMQQLGRHRSRGPSVVTMRLPVHGNRRRDAMNLISTVKYAVDGLVDAQIWPDDDDRWVTVMQPVLVPSGSMVEIVIRDRSET